MNRTSPDLKAIDQTADFNVQFYAIIGAATSLAAELEHELFNVYVTAANLEPSAAAEIFYRVVNFVPKRDAADKAVRAFGSLPTLDLNVEWPELRAELDDLCGMGTARNLVGHNIPRQTVTTRLNGDGVDVYIGNFVEQNQHQVAGGKRPAQREDYASLFAYCERAERCANRLRRLGYEMRQARERSAMPCARG